MVIFVNNYFHILPKMQVSYIFTGCSFQVFANSMESGGIVKALCVPSGTQRFSNTALKKGDIYTEAIKAGAKGLPFLKVLDDGEVFLTFVL